MPFLDLEDVKTQLNLSGTTEFDQDVTGYMNATAGVIENHTGRSPISVSFTDELTLHDWTDTIRVTHRPLTAVTSVTVEGQAVDVSSVRIRSIGLIRLGQRVRGWVDVTYMAGTPVPPENWVIAGMIIVQHLWATRRGGMQNTADQLSTPLDSTRPIVPYAIPKKALELLGPATPKVF